MAPALQLDVLPGTSAIARLEPNTEFPEWARDATLSAAVRTSDELTVVCPADAVPPEVTCEGPFRTLAVRGPLDFALTGILASLAAPLAEAGISIFALSTFDTDLLLVREHDLAAARAALEGAGHRIDG